MTESAQIPAPVSGQRVTTAILYWGLLVTGVLLPWITQIAADAGHRGKPLMPVLAEFCDGFWLRLFAPGDGRLFMSLLGALPFALYALFVLFHLGRAYHRGEIIARRRRLALIIGAAAMVMISAWGHYGILTAKGSTAGIGLIFLPFHVLIAALIGYGLGRLAAGKLLR